MQLSEHFRADQKLKQITKTIVQMPGEGDADPFSLAASDRMHGESCVQRCPDWTLGSSSLPQGEWLVSHWNWLPKVVVSALSQSVGLILYVLLICNLNKKVFSISAFMHRNQSSMYLYSCIFVHCCSFKKTYIKCSLQYFMYLLWYI